MRRRPHALPAVFLALTTLAPAHAGEPDGHQASGGPGPRRDPVAIARTIEFTAYGGDLGCDAGRYAPIQATLDSLTRQDVEGLLASDDPHAIGVGIYLASHRAYLDLLLNNPHFVDDRRASLPSAMCSGLYSAPPSVSQTTVRSRYFAAVEFWFGRCGSTREKLAVMFPPGTDPWSYIRPWEILVNRAQRASEGDRRNLKTRILKLDERTRWAVLLQSLPEPGRRDLFTENEIRSELKRLSPEMRQAILDKTAPLPPDNTYKHEGMRAHTYRIAEILLTDKPLPDPLENIPEPFREMFENERRMLEAERRRAEEAATPRRDQ